jgi:hypothetical protein
VLAHHGILLGRQALAPFGIGAFNLKAMHVGHDVLRGG